MKFGQMGETAPQNSNEDLNKKESSLFDSIVPKGIRKRLNAALLVAMTLAGPMDKAAEAKSGHAPTPPKPAAGRVEHQPKGLEMAQNIAKGLREKGFNWPKMHTAFTYEDEKGEEHFNWYSLIAPVQVEIPREINEPGHAEFQIPYEYSRQFNSAKALNQSDHEKLAGYIDQELRQELVETLHGFDRSKQVHRYKEGNEKPSDLEITGISVTGYASPEGPEQKGSTTIEQGNVDPENIALAYHRAEEALGVTEDQMRSMGMNLDAVSETVGNIHGEELQFSDDEWKAMEERAKQYVGYGGADGIFETIVAYNRGEIKDESFAKPIDEILARKRSVEVSVDYKGKTKETYLVPVPLVPLLFMKRRRKESGPDPITPKDPKNYEWPDTFKYGKLDDVTLRDIPEEQLRAMEKEALVNDIYRYFDDEKSIQRGVDYLHLTNAYQEQVKERGVSLNDEKLLAAAILRDWQEHDANEKRAAGITTDVYKGLDYRNQPEQIRWARVHARVIQEITRRNRANKKENKEVPLETILREMVHESRKGQ